MTAPHTPSRPMVGAGWMLGEVATITAMIASVRYVSDAIPPHEIVVFRGLFGLLVQLPWLLRVGLDGIRPSRPALIGLRSAFACAGMLVWFVALSAMPISDAVALAFTSPLFAILGAGIILREKVGARRWAVALIGFCGALIMIRPGYVAFNLMALFAMTSALMNAGVQLTTKRLAGAASGEALAFYMNSGLIVGGIGFAIGDWVAPAWADLPWLLAIGLFGTLAHIFLTRAMEVADASLMSPIDFARLPFAAFYGWMLFRETSDIWTWAGAAVIFAAVTWNTRFEAKRAGGPGT